MALVAWTELFSQDGMLFSVIIPLAFHRFHAVDCVRGWISFQNLPGDEFELLCVLPEHDPDKLRGLLEPLLRPHDRLITSAETHDMAHCAEAAALARGALLLFSEAHVWPETDVLQAAKTVFEKHPDWAAFSGRTTRVANGRLAQMEADFYERDIDRAMIAHPWRKILDQCFITRRQAYFDAGGFDPEFGHFAEWVLAARYFDRGLKVGYAPHITLCHYYSGEIEELRGFTKSFVEGEIRFFARGGEVDHTIWDEVLPPEWSQRGNFDRRLARSLAICLRKSALMHPNPIRCVRLLYESFRWTIVAAHGGAWPRRATQWQVAWRYAQLRTAARAGSRSALGRRFESFLRALIHAHRLDEIALQPPAADLPCETRDIAPGDIRHESHMTGFHLVETYQGRPMRWSEPAAVIELAAPAARFRIGLHCAPVRRSLERLSLLLFIDELPVAKNRITYSRNSVTIELERATPGILRLAWICKRFGAPGDTRHLGLPLAGITVESC